MIIGISTMILGEMEKKLGFDDVLFLKESGLRYIELSNYHHIDEEVNNFISESNMAFYSIHAEYNQCDISGIDPFLKERGIEDALKRIDAASKYGAKILVIHPGGWFEDDSRDARIKNCVDSLVKISNYANSKNIKVAVENLPMGFFGEDLVTLDTVFSQTIGRVDNADGVGICLDTGHAFLTGNLYELVSTFKDHIITMHVQDNLGDNNKDRAKAMDDLHLPPGQGNIDWDRFFESLDEINYQGAMIFELKGNSIEGQDKDFVRDKLFNFLQEHPFFKEKVFAEGKEKTGKIK